jgi:hypothetical protein
MPFRNPFFAASAPESSFDCPIKSRFDFFRLELKLNFAEKILPWRLKKNKKEKWGAAP